MVNYKCLRCGFINIRRGRFIQHLNRKFTCNPKLKDISIKEIYKFYFKKDIKSINIAKTPKDSKTTPKDSEIVSTVKGLLQGEII